MEVTSLLASKRRHLPEGGVAGSGADLSLLGAALLDHLLERGAKRRVA